ncbi:hypothetical protein [Azohydromonas aeria]|uniref:hypothetical protein n=1 Tax=Azohydromonas aeria TaxID=2590212 RepID=UPI0012FC5A3D|nr:hypothetical protein [Azohydromonas aeria]
MSASPQRPLEGRHLLRLWLGLLLPGVGWALQLAVNYAAVPWLCDAGRSRLWLLAPTLGALVLAALGLAIAWRLWRGSGGGWEAAGGEHADHTRFMSLCALLLGGFVSLLILLQALPGAWLTPCD